MNENSCVFSGRFLSNLKCFSMTIFDSTYGYDVVIVPFLRQISQLTKLTLSFTIGYRTSFIDGTELYNDFLIEMKNIELIIYTCIRRNNPMCHTNVSQGYVYGIDLYLQFPKTLSEPSMV